MSHVLAYTSPARGHLYPITPILDELKLRGHDISLRTLASHVSLMQARGFRAAPISTAVESIEHDDWQARNPRQALQRAVQGFVKRAEHDAPDLQHAIADEKPDALLVDMNSWGAMAVAEKWGGPWAAFLPYPIFLSSPEVPPFGPGLAPARGPFGRLRDRLLRPLVTGAVERSFLPALNRVRAQVGVAPSSSADEMFLHPPLLIYMTAEPFEYPRHIWADNIVMVGPCEWEPPSDPPAWLAETTGPLVLVTTSSEFQNDGRLIEVACEALANEPVTVVATVPAGEPIGFHLPRNARVERFVPHSLVLDHAVCAITHGGMGVTQKALARGVPVCAVPFGRDQMEVARRVEVSGAGTRLPAKRLTAQRLRNKVREAMTKTEGARRVAAVFTRAGGPRTAAQAFESRLLVSPRRQHEADVAHSQQPTNVT